MKIAKTRLLVFTAATALFTIGHAFADELSIMASGGAWQDAQRKAWFEPFSKETGAKSSSRNISAISARSKPWSTPATCRSIW